MEATTKQKKKWLTNELIFVLYFWRLVILKPLTTTYREYGMYFVLAFSVVLLILSVKINGFRFVEANHTFVLIFGFYALFLSDYLFRPTQYVTDYMYELVLFGIIPVVFTLRLQNIKRLFVLYGWSSLILFVFYAYDPLNGFKYMDNYMTFGFQVALPAFFGMDITRSFLKKKWFLIPEIACLVELIVFSNRSCLLSVAVYFVLKELLMYRNDIKQVIKRMTFICFSFIVLYNAAAIVTWIYEKLSAMGYRSYSLSQYVYYIENGRFDTIMGATGGRGNIWNNAMNMFWDSPLIGSGSGAFIEKHGYYTHNIITDLLVQYGFIVFIIVSCLIVWACIKCVKCHDLDIRLLGLFFFCLWCPKLMFSVYLFKDIGLWCFLAVGLRRDIKCKFVLNEDDRMVV